VTCSAPDLLNADAVCHGLGIQPPACWAETWAQSQMTFATEATAALDAARIAEACDAARMAGEVADLAVGCARMIAADARLMRLAWHCHWLIFRSGLDPRVNSWPPATEAGDRMLYAVVLLSGLPWTRTAHAVRGIDPWITADTVADLELWIREHKRRTGSWGFSQLGWLAHHFQGKLFSLGRLQFLLGHYYDHLVFYRHASTRRVVALAEDGLLFRNDGQFASADGGAVTSGLWLSRLITSEGSIQGNPVSPMGHVAQAQVELPLSQWHEILRPRDPVMTVHIPASGPMDPEACGQSFRLAAEFFARHFPDMPFRAFTCHSWLLDPQFETMSAPPRNIVAFLREWYLHPVERASDGQTWERLFDVFDGKPPTLDDAPADTSLRRTVIEFMRAGGRCRTGGSVLFAEDLNWGEQVYRPGLETGS